MIRFVLFHVVRVGRMSHVDGYGNGLRKVRGMRSGMPLQDDTPSIVILERSDRIQNIF